MRAPGAVGGGSEVTNPPAMTGGPFADFPPGAGASWRGSAALDASASDEVGCWSSSLGAKTGVSNGGKPSVTAACVMPAALAATVIGLVLPKIVWLTIGEAGEVGDAVVCVVCVCTGSTVGGGI